MTHATHTQKRHGAPNDHAAYTDTKVPHRRYAAVHAHATAHRRIVRRKKSVVYEKHTERKLSLSKWFFIYAFVIFIGAMLMITSSAGLTAKKKRIAALKEEIKVYQEKNRDTRLSLLADFDEAELTAAAKQAGMGVAQPYQIITVNVPKDSYAKGGGAAESIPDVKESALSVLLDFFGKLFNR